MIDTGILPSYFAPGAELVGRISANSTGIAGNSDHIADTSPEAAGESDHGTLVSLVAAAANDSQGTVGIAYNATIMAIRADDPGTCASVDGCNFGDVSAGIQWAVDHGATVINMSLGGATATVAERNAVAAAAAAGIVVVISAGNDGALSPDPFGRSLVNSGATNVIIVGSVNSTGTISDFSDRAGNGSFTDYYLAAFGERVRVELDDGSYLISGTSFSAPQVAGAVALIAQAFPAMTAEEIVDLLLTTAQDVGAPGTDNVYGRGILDIYEAFQPQGTTTLASKTTAAIPLGDTSAVGSPAMGDALSRVSLRTLVLDRYRRAFSTDLGASMRGATVPTKLNDAIGRPTRFVASSSGKAAMAFTIDASNPGAVRASAGQLSLTTEDAEAAKVLAARIALQISPKAQLGFAYAEGPDGLVMQLQGQERPAFLIAGSATGDDGMFRRTDVSLAFRRKLGNWGLTLSGESGQSLSGDVPLLVGDRRDERFRDGVWSFGLTADRRFGPLGASLGMSWMREERTVLGGRFHDAFGGGGAGTLFLDANAGWDIARNWRLTGALRQGFTYADESSVIGDGSVIASRAWSLDLERRGVFSDADRIGFRVAQPLRVEGGGLNLSLPVAYSYDTGSATFALLPLSLAPEGREIMGELAWHGPLWNGAASASFYFRRDPGHYADIPDDAGVAVRWSKEF